MPPQGEPLSAGRSGCCGRGSIRARKKIAGSVADRFRRSCDRRLVFPARKASGATPAIKDPWIAGPIDAFVLEKLPAPGRHRTRAAGRSREPDSPRLPRRARAAARAETNQAFRPRPRSPGVYALVDEVLASPRPTASGGPATGSTSSSFADTDGYENNAERPGDYHFRDYLIRALNKDRPWDRMIVEQLAGDTMGEDAATGLYCGRRRSIGSKSPQNELLTRTQRQDELADMIGTTGSSPAGADRWAVPACHDHKFDPIHAARLLPHSRPCLPACSTKSDPLHVWGSAATRMWKASGWRLPGLAASGRPVNSAAERGTLSTAPVQAAALSQILSHERQCRAVP